MPKAERVPWGIDDASRVITHDEFFYRDNTDNMIEAFRSALFKRGKPARLYFDNGSNYTSKEILQACVRLDIRLTHAPVRDGAAKGKIERFFRGFRDRFLTQHTRFESLADLNAKTHAWIEDRYCRSRAEGKLDNAKPRPKKAGASWTAEEDQQLFDTFKCGEPVSR